MIVTLVTIIGFVVLGLAGNGSAQSGRLRETKRLRTAAGSGATEAEQQTGTGRDASFRVNSELVVIPVSVTDRNGHTALGLRPDDFVIAEDGLQQPIVSVSQWNAPGSIGLVVDASGSMKRSIRSARVAVRALLGESERGDEAFLITFADRPLLESDFTSGVERIIDRLLAKAPRGATALFDAIYAGLDRMKSAATPRKALVVITDGGDNHSRYSFGELVAAARESDVQIHTVALRRDVRDPNEQRGRLQLEQLANETGGRLLIVDSATQLTQAMVEINRLIRNQYLLAYRPVYSANDGGWHSVRVRLQPHWQPSLYRIYAKRGYYAPEQ